jgi:hypothetical protein
MEIANLRRELHTLIDTESEDTLQEVYDLLKGNEYSDDYKQILDSEYVAWQQDKAVVSKNEMDEILNSLRK